MLKGKNLFMLFSWLGPSQGLKKTCSNKQKTPGPWDFHQGTHTALLQFPHQYIRSIHHLSLHGFLSQLKSHSFTKADGLWAFRCINKHPPLGLHILEGKKHLPGEITHLNEKKKDVLGIFPSLSCSTGFCTSTGY